jgi:hypothetical protein
MTLTEVKDGWFHDSSQGYNTGYKGADPSLLDALRDMPFGSYGALTDKFGVRWMFQGERHG